MADGFDPNDPSTYQLVKVRLLTSAEEAALQIHNLRIEELIERFLNKDLPTIVRNAKRKLTESKNLVELRTMLNAKG